MAFFVAQKRLTDRRTDFADGAIFVVKIRLVYVTNSNIGQQYG